MPTSKSDKNAAKTPISDQQVKPKQRKIKEKKTKDRSKENDKADKKTIPKQSVLKLFERQKQLESKEKDKLMSINTEINKSSILASKRTSETERLKQTQIEPQDRLKQLTPNSTPLPSAKAKTRTPPSIEREPVHKKLLLSLPEDKIPKINMEAVTHQDLQQSEECIIKAMGEMLKPLQRELQQNNSKIDGFGTELVNLRNENSILKTKVSNIEVANKQLNLRVIKLENQLLERNIIIKGIPEAKWEKPETTWNKVLCEISETVGGDRYEERMIEAKKFSITHTRRLGPRQEMTNRPILVKFSCKEDAEYLVRNRKYLKKGIYLDFEYTPEVERERRLLRPILRAARNITEFQGKCRLEGGELIIKNIRYNSQNLHRLPPPLSGFYATSRSNTTTLGFFGELNPLSNFHESPFIVNNVCYHSSEQYIQHMKSELFKDTNTSVQILSSTTAFECKQLARDIANYNRDIWIPRAKELCKPGISAKFEQNSNLTNVLLNTGDLKLIESSKDRDWGTCIPIHDDRCLLQEHWAHQGILGEILEEIRTYLQNKVTPRSVETNGMEPTASDPENQAAGEVETTGNLPTEPNTAEMEH